MERVPTPLAFPSSPARPLMLGMVLLIAACGSDAPGRTDAGILLDTGETDTDLGLNVSCQDNTDCAGGEICRDRACREACNEQDSCEGDLTICDSEQGYCVGCLVDEDCGTNEACEDTVCLFRCREDTACGDTEYCELGSGNCAERECEEDLDCGGGYQCNGYVCASIDDIVCEAEGLQCDENTLVICARDGTSEDRFDCGDRRCIEVEGDARCADPACAPNELGCIDDDTAFVCDGTGTIETPLPCSGDQYCESGVCREPVCEPDSEVCDGNAIASCDSLGSSVVVANCAERAVCEASERGCTCVDGECEPRLCTPGTARCSDDGVEVCADDGFGYESPDACDDDQVCVAGGCLPRNCDAGTSQCVGDTLVVCNEDGTDRMEIECAETEQICTGDEGPPACSARACVPETLECDESGTSVVSCNARGSEQTTTSCRSDEFCDGGICAAQVCDPSSADVCIDGDVQKCNPIGSDHFVVEDCDDHTEICSDAACVDVSCIARGPVSASIYLGTGCGAENALLLDDNGAGLVREPPDPASYIGEVDVSSCLEVEFEDAREVLAIRVVARSLGTDPICGDTCSGTYCGSGRSFEFFVSPDGTDYQWVAAVGVRSEFETDVVTVDTLVRSVLLCRRGTSQRRDNLEVDYVAAECE